MSSATKRKLKRNIYNYGAQLGDFFSRMTQQEADDKQENKAKSLVFLGTVLNYVTDGQEQGRWRQKQSKGK